MSKGLVLGAILGAAAAAAPVASALSCLTPYEVADLELVSVTVGGETLEDLSAYTGQVRIEAGYEHVVFVWESGEFYAYDPYQLEVQ